MSSNTAVLACDEAGVVREVILQAPFVDTTRALGQPLVALLNPDCAIKALTMLDELRTTGSVAAWELTARVADEFVPIRVTGVAHGGRWVLIATVVDHHMNDEQATGPPQAVERRRESGPLEQLTLLNNEMAAIQRQLAKKNAELARLNAHKDAILAYVAHDLRNPLGVVHGFAELMRRDADQLSARQLRFLDLIVESTNFMAEMVKDLLDVSAIEAGRLKLARQPIDLVDLVDRAVARNRVVAADKAIMILLARDDGPVWIEGDPARLDQVMNNLLSNAIKYSEPGAGVEVVLGVDANQATVEVRDRGQGIPPGELDHVFEAFHTTSARPTGGEKSTGLGLAIVKHIVEAHGGRIRVESEVGVGTSFHLRVPCCEAPT